MSETLLFHSQLSSIMERLVISAVSEINKLVSDYCAAVLLKDQLKTRHHSVHQPASEEPHRNTAIGTNEAGLLAALTQQSTAARCPPAPPAGWRHNNKTVAATQTEEEPEEEEEEDGRLTPCDYKTELVGTVKNERLRGNKAAEKAQSCSSPLVSQQQRHHQAELSLGSPGEWQQFHIPEESKEEHHHATDDHHQPTDAQQQLNMAACLEQLRDEVGILIKREPESVDLDPPPSSLEDQDPSLHLSFQLHPGAVGHQMYPGGGGGDYGASCDMMPDLSLMRRGGGGGGHHHASNDDLSSSGPFGHHHHHQARSNDGHHHQGGGSGPPPCKVVCEFCGKGFSYNSELKRHAVTHTGERTQHCEQCGKSFIRRSHLLRHKLLHTGFRPFTCPICYRRFSRTSHLERHMKTHLC